MTDLGDIPVSELEHHGIKGMKWGVRRTDAQLGKAKLSPEKKKAVRAVKRADRKIKRLDSQVLNQIESNFHMISRASGLMDKSYDKEIEKLRKADRSFRKSKMTKDEKYLIEKKALNKALVQTMGRGAAVSAVVLASGFAATQVGDIRKYGITDKQAAAGTAGLMAMFGGQSVSDIASILEARSYIDSQQKLRDMNRERDRLRRAADRLED